MASGPVKVAFLLADYGHDPTETAVPYQVFKDAGFTVSFLTEAGRVPECDRLMLKGWTQKLLGAEASAIRAYDRMTESPEWQQPLSWDAETVDLAHYDLVFLPGGHDKGVRQILDSARAQSLLAAYFVQVKKPSRKSCAAICHGVQALAHSKVNGQSVLHDVTTTALPAQFEKTAYYGTCLFLGDYYKTYGAGTDDVEQIVKQTLADPQKQWKSSGSMSKPFVVEDETHNYLSGRWPGDAQVLAEKTVGMVKKALGG